MLTDDELQELYDKHCRLCGTQRCTGMWDEFFREGCPHYQAAINEKKFSKRTGINPNELYDEFVEHINSMTREELLESMQKAEEMTAGCNDDWPDNLVEVTRCKDCLHRASLDCPMFFVTSDPPWDDVIEDRTEDSGFCNKGKPIPNYE